MKRQKYKCKNINGFKQHRECTVPDCKEIGFVSFRNDPPSGTVKVEFRCIPHVGWVKEEPEVIQKAKNPNLYTVMTDFQKYMSLANYHTGVIR